MFKRAGLDASIQMIGTGAAIVAAVAGHTVDIGMSNVVTIAQAHAKDLPFSFVAPGSMYLSTAPNAQFVVMPQSAFTRPKTSTVKPLPASPSPASSVSRWTPGSIRTAATRAK